jgi:ribosome-associated toxin RatA of RatAB toxin-antitoxin module
MKSSNREEIVDHDAKGLFDIVLDIESYPYFIPWCSAMRIHSKNKNEIYADMVVWYKYFMPQTFGSHVTFDKKKLSISVEFEFKRFFHQKIAEAFFPLIENKMIESFKVRADEILD